MSFVQSIVIVRKVHNYVSPESVTFFISVNSANFFYGAAAQRGPWPPHS